MSEQKNKEPTEVPSHHHPLFSHYCNSNSWKKGLLARKSLLRHVRASEDAVIHLVSHLATLEIAAMSNKTEWENFLNRFSEEYGETALNQLVTACQHWVMISFEAPESYLKDVDSFMGMFVIQMAPNSILPSKLKNDFKEQEFKDLLSENPIVMFLIAIFLGGPLSNKEAKQMFKTSAPSAKED